jgi:hypothetical protein
MILNLHAGLPQTLLHCGRIGADEGRFWKGRGKIGHDGNSGGKIVHDGEPDGHEFR